MIIGMPLIALRGFQEERALLRNVTERSALTRQIRPARQFESEVLSSGTHLNDHSVALTTIESGRAQPQTAGSSCPGLGAGDLRGTA